MIVRFQGVFITHGGDPTANSTQHYISNKENSLLQAKRQKKPPLRTTYKQSIKKNKLKSTLRTLKKNIKKIGQLSRVT